MKKSFVSILTVVVFVLGLAGCASIPKEHEGAGKGAGIGAATGALAGAVLAGEGSRTQGALLGGLVGALIGGVVGDYTIDQKKSADETASNYKYQSSMGTLIRIESNSADPYTVRPGGKVDLLTTYAVMAPNSSTSVTVTESHEIRHNNELVGKPTLNVNHKAGTYTSSIPLFLPSNALAGTYQVITTISTGAGSDSRETSFIVQ
jgi:hypothetical protein